MGRREAVGRCVTEFVQRLQERYRLCRAILFGSRAGDDWLVDSDYDFVIVSPDFAGKRFVDRAVEVSYLWESDAGLEALCYTPEEFRRKAQQIGIVAEAIRTGIELVKEASTNEEPVTASPRDT